MLLLTYAIRILTTSGTRLLSCGINTNRKRKVLSESFAKMLDSWLAWSRRSRERKIVPIMTE
jgi:hypothetical protein